MTKVTKTFLRSPETMAKYMKVSEERRINGHSVNPFLSLQEKPVKDFKYWVIIDNEFPYDAIATVSHMISPKREVAFDWELLNEDEKSEFEEIKNSYIKANYDVLWENLPSGQTIKGHFHLHLIVLKREQS